MVIDDPRWRQPKARFAEFLKDQIPVDRGTMRGILLLPVCLAAAATLIGLVWHLQS